MSCVEDTQTASTKLEQTDTRQLEKAAGHCEARTHEVSWVDPSCDVRTQQDSCVVECLCKEREVVDEQTGQVTGVRVEKTQWVCRSGNRTMATTICRLSTYLALPCPASQVPPYPASAWRSSGSPAASAWTSDQDMSVSSLETNNSSLP